MKYIAVLGHGTVGSGVTELFTKNRSSIERKAGMELDIKYILDIRDFPDHPLADRFTKDFEKIVNDPEVAVVVEVIGGLKPAYDYVKRCLESGKSVVTSNKELVATHGA
ncbi:MAG: homoserine dehydrogenase, partial [Clostridia bacterium]|nr:homoserine dehydrogenase [Clostridia bacterium]